MIKVVIYVRREPGLDQAEFHRYWLKEHGPLVKSLASTTGALRYVQSHTIAPDRNDAIQRGRGTAPPCDGIAEVWFDSLQALADRFQTDEARAADRAMQQDEARFIDLSASAVFITEESEIF
jgi:uncharacterized protein (TIGR02118 family)